MVAVSPALKVSINTIYPVPIDSISVSTFVLYLVAFNCLFANNRRHTLPSVVLFLLF